MLGIISKLAQKEVNFRKLWIIFRLHKKILNVSQFGTTFKSISEKHNKKSGGISIERKMCSCLPTFWEVKKITRIFSGLFLILFWIEYLLQVWVVWPLNLYFSDSYVNRAIFAQANYKFLSFLVMPLFLVSVPLV
jgi:hypothetical protein